MRYTKEQKEFIFKTVTGRPVEELTATFNEKYKTSVTNKAMKSFKKNHKLRSGIGTAHKGKSIYPDAIIEFIKRNHKDTGHKNMAELIKMNFGESYTQRQMKYFYHNYGLNSGLTGRFPKGHIPANKGKPGKTTGRMAETQFKKGHTPLNHKQIGSERISVDGYIEIKVAEPRKWRQKHVVAYETHHGAVPKGHCVIFGDGNKQNIDINNLILVTRSQLLRLNQGHLIKSDIELTNIGIAVVNIKIRAAELKNKKLNKNKRSERIRCQKTT